METLNESATLTGWVWGRIMTGGISGDDIAELMIRLDAPREYAVSLVGRIGGILGFVDPWAPDTECVA